MKFDDFDSFDDYWQFWLVRVGISEHLIGYFIQKNLQNCGLRVYNGGVKTSMSDSSLVETKRSLVNST